jgi:hypothetical protein
MHWLAWPSSRSCTYSLRGRGRADCLLYSRARYTIFSSGILLIMETFAFSIIFYLKTLFNRWYFLYSLIYQYQKLKKDNIVFFIEKHHTHHGYVPCTHTYKQTITSCALHVKEINSDVTEINWISRYKYKGLHLH